MLGVAIGNSLGLYAKIYNGIIGAKQSVHSSIADLEAEYQRRYALVDNLVLIVKETKAFEKELVGIEKEIYIKVAEAKAAATKMDVSVPDTVQAKVKSENDLSKILTNAMDKLMVLAQHYPTINDPKIKDRNETFESLKTLRRELKDLEENIAYSRKVVNERVRVYNQTIQVWPSNVIAGMSNFKDMPFFQVHDEAARRDVKISF
jgi:LemA protein